MPTGRLVDPQDYVGAAIFLASKASDFVTGQTVFVDGGSILIWREHYRFVNIVANSVRVWVCCLPRLFYFGIIPISTRISRS